MSSAQPLPGGFEAFAVGYGDLWTMVEEITRYAADVIVLEPPELREAVQDALRRVVTAHDRVGV